MEQEMNVSGYIKEISRDEFLENMQHYEVVGFRIVLREEKIN